MKDFNPMKHLKLEPLPQGMEGAMLKHIFAKQEELMHNYNWHKGRTPELITIVFAQAIASEAQELMNQTNWKPWKETKKPFDRTETVFEYIDILHFLVNGLIALDVSAEECMQYYLAKNKENQRRIESGY